MDLYGEGRSAALLVDDDPDMLGLLAQLMQGAGITALPAGDPSTALGLYESGQPAVAVVDLNLAPFDGLDLVVELRRRNAWLPILVLTGRGADDDKVRALEAGADDYVVKPFSQRELVARVRANLRRAARDREPRAGPVVLEAGPLKMDLDRRSVSVDGKDLHLTAMEFRLLQFLLERHNVVVPTGEIAKTVWGYDDAPAREVVRVTLHRLRRKIGDDATSPRFIQTVPGVGVRLRHPALEPR